MPASILGVIARCLRIVSCAISAAPLACEVLALYAAALATERLDHEVFAAGGWISGHTVKHVLAAVAAAWFSRMLRLRSPASAESAP